MPGSNQLADGTTNFSGGRTSTPFRHVHGPAKRHPWMTAQQGIVIQECEAWFPEMLQSAAELVEDTSEFFVDSAFADRDGDTATENESTMAAVADVQLSDLHSSSSIEARAVPVHKVPAMVVGAWYSCL